MKPINYSDKIHGRYYDTLTPKVGINTTVRVLDKTKIEKLKLWIKKWIHFWAIMLLISDLKKK